jgi:hypothetical protein
MKEDVDYSYYGFCKTDLSLEPYFKEYDVKGISNLVQPQIYEMSYYITGDLISLNSSLIKNLFYTTVIDAFLTNTEFCVAYMANIIYVMDHFGDCNDLTEHGYFISDNTSLIFDYHEDELKMSFNLTNVISYNSYQNMAIDKIFFSYQKIYRNFKVRPWLRSAPVQAFGAVLAHQTLFFYIAFNQK